MISKNEERNTTVNADSLLHLPLDHQAALVKGKGKRKNQRKQQEIHDQDLEIGTEAMNKRRNQKKNPSNNPIFTSNIYRNALGASSKKMKTAT